MPCPHFFFLNFPQDAHGCKNRNMTQEVEGDICSVSSQEARRRRKVNGVSKTQVPSTAPLCHAGGGLHVQAGSRRGSMPVSPVDTEYTQGTPQPSLLVDLFLA